MHSHATCFLPLLIALFTGTELRGAAEVNGVEIHVATPQGADARLAETQATEVRVPKGSPVVIDGRLAPGEWEGAYEATLSDGSRLWLRHDGEFLYLGMRLASHGFPSACVILGDTMRVLHSSAALASASYVRAGATWPQRSRFGAFAIRSADTGAAGKAVQRAYLGSERWVASNDAMSRTDREMQWSLSLMDRRELRLALGAYNSVTEGAVAWPTALADGCTALKTVQGFLPTELVLEPAKWARLVLMP